MTTRTPAGSLYISSVTDPDSQLIISDEHAAIRLIAVNRAPGGGNVHLYFEAEQLDQLAAEITRIREEHDI